MDDECSGRLGGPKWSHLPAVSRWPHSPIVSVTEYVTRYVRSTRTNKQILPTPGSGGTSVRGLRSGVTNNNLWELRGILKKLWESVARKAIQSPTEINPNTAQPVHQMRSSAHWKENHDQKTQRKHVRTSTITANAGGGAELPLRVCSHVSCGISVNTFNARGLFGPLATMLLRSALPLEKCVESITLFLVARI